MQYLFWQQYLRESASMLRIHTLPVLFNILFLNNDTVMSSGLTGASSSEQESCLCRSSLLLLLIIEIIQQQYSHSLSVLEHRYCWTGSEVLMLVPIYVDQSILGYDAVYIGIKKSTFRRMLLHPSPWTTLRADACNIYPRSCPSQEVYLVERLIPRSRVLLAKQKGPLLVKELLACCENLRFTMCAQQPAIFPYPKPDQSSLRCTNHFFFYDPF